MLNITMLFVTSKLDHLSNKMLDKAATSNVAWILGRKLPLGQFFSLDQVSMGKGSNAQSPSSIWR